MKMAIANVYNAIYEGWHTQEEALDYARGLVWDEIETTEEELLTYHCYPIKTIDGVGVFYNYMQDHYFFTEENEDEL